MGWFSELGSAILGYRGTKSQNIASAQQAERQMAFQERMSNTQHQRQIADLKAAGLNPILSVTGASKGAGTPSGAQAPQYNKYQVALQNAATAQNIANLKEQRINTQANTNLAYNNMDIAHNAWQAGLGAAELGKQYQRYLQSAGGKAATLAGFYANSAKNVTSMLGQLIPFTGGKPK